MKKQLLHLVYCGILLLFAGNTIAQGIRFLHDEPLEKILDMARQQNKIIFIDGYTQTCAPCKQLDQEVFPLQKVGDYFNSNFINVKYDLDQPEGKKLRAQYKDVITGYPSLILLDQDGKMIHKMGGFHPADSLIAKMQAALNGNSLSAMRARLRAGEKSLAFVQTYKQSIEDGFLREESEKVDREILDRITDEEMLDPKMWSLVGRSVSDPYSPVFGRVVKNYWGFRMKRVTDLGMLEFQLRTAIQNAADEMVKPQEKDGKLILKQDPAKEAILSSYLNDDDRFKHTEAIRALFNVHRLALNNRWAELTSALKYYNQIHALGSPSKITYPYIRYMMQYCKDKAVLTAAATLLSAMPKEKMDIMDHDDNYNTIIKLCVLAGKKKEADRYAALSKSNR
ncbi:thioredoxin family protein [Mucilaginibacter paludis]|uniref:Thioredoxin domain-containing protein n=1 Tax=Mucilaginibacter paludis DSM 18603 TaxID=714943 RepID=H1YFY7_9SPHI|nr:thioredoxin fold domain-containing protein [Mucilaginibacter paludis]EHQ26275.1 thioredoxin domain-containing protein [Mucilaginibacter paludis DSM 18603]